VPGVNDSPFFVAILGVELPMLRGDGSALPAKLSATSLRIRALKKKVMCHFLWPFKRHGHKIADVACSSTDDSEIAVQFKKAILILQDMVQALRVMGTSMFRFFSERRARCCSICLKGTNLQGLGRIGFMASFSCSHNCISDDRATGVYVRACP
jgi:hypothetical protein